MNPKYDESKEIHLNFCKLKTKLLKAEKEKHNLRCMDFSSKKQEDQKKVVMVCV